MTDVNRKLVSVLNTLVTGYKSKDFLTNHECEKCCEASRAFEQGEINLDNIKDQVCAEALDNINKVARADMIIHAYEGAQRIFKEKEDAEYGTRVFEELGLRFI